MQKLAGMLGHNDPLIMKIKLTLITITQQHCLIKRGFCQTGSEDLQKLCAI